MANTKITTNVIADDAITGAKIADDAINSEHYTDGSIDTAHIADDQVTLAKMAGIARGKIIYGDSSGNPAVLTVGSAGTVLTSDGTDISWAEEVATNYLPLAGGTMTGNIAHAGDFTLDVGGDIILDTGGDDIKFKVGGTDFGSITYSNSNLYLKSAVSDGDIIFTGNDGGSSINALTLDMSDAGSAYFNHDIYLVDEGQIRLGASNDLKIYHYSNNSYIDEQGAGDLYIRGSSNVRITDTDNNKMFLGQDGGEVQLYYDGSQKLATKTGGINITGDTDTDTLTVSGNATVGGTLGVTGVTTLTGNVGIDESSPTVPLQIGGAANSDKMIIASDSDPGRGLKIATYVRNGQNNAGVNINAQDTGHANYPELTFRLANDTRYAINEDGQFWYHGTEKMRLDSSGHLSVGKSSTGLTNTGTTLYNNGGIDIVHSLTSTNETTVWNNNNDSGATYILDFRQNNSTAGSIDVASSSTSYTTSSDYRLKENVDYTWDATTRLKQLKPARFNWIKDDTNTLLDGFLAHEVSSIVPEAVSGEKDGERMQGIDHSKLVPLLVKTIQELEARITALES